MRDFLMAPDSRVAQSQVEKWTAIGQQTDHAVAECAAALDPAEATLFGNLKNEVQVYWKVLEFISEMQENDKRTRGSEFFSSDLVRRRNAMLDLVDRIDQISMRELASGDAKLNVTFDRLRVRLVWMLALTLGVGLVLAAFTIRRSLHLEAELQRRYEEGVRAQQELKELSARLGSAQEEER